MKHKYLLNGVCPESVEIDKNSFTGRPCTYILRCSDGSLYTGWTNNIETRLASHNAGRGGKYTRGRIPVTLVHVEYFDTKEEAMSREYAIKRLPRSEKDILIGADKLNEANSYMDLDEILSEIIEEARAINIPVPYHIKPQVKINSRPKKRLGCCYKEGRFFVIEISKFLLDAVNDAATCNADFNDSGCDTVAITVACNTAMNRVRQTIAHEVLHTCPECFDHGPLWRTYAAMMNNTYGYSIEKTTKWSVDEPCVNRKQSDDSRLDGAGKAGTDIDSSNVHGHGDCPKYLYMIHCKSCGKEYPRQRFTKAMRKINAYRCSCCGGQLEWYNL